ncbi:MAG: trypsin-like peptidase domain-containing protein [Victivallaceae bacterium]|nr:trypsin-like peptidase domain-containing protein [Victivallaceae bacterium]
MIARPVILGLMLFCVGIFAYADSLFEGGKTKSASPEELSQLSDAVVTIRGKNGSGTGFKVRFKKQLAIVTNAHVFFMLEEPKIADVAGRVYPVKEVFGVRGRDLAILMVTPPQGGASAVLPVASDVSKMIRRKIVVCGNSLGEGVLTHLTGIVFGISGELIEVTAGIVPGNSGSPVVDQKSGAVLGVATFGKLVPDSVWNNGSPFGGHATVRRFATRIDNLSEKDLIAFKKGNYRNDVNALKALDDHVEHIERLCQTSGMTKERFRREIRNDSIAHAWELWRFFGNRWSSDFLRQYGADKVKLIDRIYRDFGLGDLRSSCEIAAVWSRAARHVRMIPGKARSVTCPHCQGTCRVSRGMEIKKCPRCKGNGSILSAPRPDRYEVLEPVFSAMARSIRPSKRLFNGLCPGGAMDAELARWNYYYNNTTLRIQENRFGQTRECRGNKLIPQATRTRLCFMFGKLVAVEILFPAGSDLTFFRELVSKDFNRKEDLFTVSVQDSSLIARHHAYEILLALPDPQLIAAMKATGGL